MLEGSKWTVFKEQILPKPFFVMYLVRNKPVGGLKIYIRFAARLFSTYLNMYRERLDLIFIDNVWQNIETFCMQNSMFKRIHSKPDTVN